jgi:hypothetical protein
VLNRLLAQGPRDQIGIKKELLEDGTVGPTNGSSFSGVGRGRQDCVRLSITPTDGLCRTHDFERGRGRRTKCNR